MRAGTVICRRYKVKRSFCRSLSPQLLARSSKIAYGLEQITVSMLMYLLTYSFTIFTGLYHTITYI